MVTLKKVNRSRGILLIEALVSFALFLVASIAIYGMMATARNAEAKAGQIVIANAYARELMESQRIKGYSAIKVGTTTGAKAVTTDRSGVSGNVRMTYLITVYEGPGTGVRDIVVRVSGKFGAVSLEGYVTL